MYVYETGEHSAGKRKGSSRPSRRVVEAMVVIAVSVPVSIASILMIVASIGTWFAFW
jgi:hypothetical protein